MISTTAAIAIPQSKSVSIVEWSRLVGIVVGGLALWIALGLLRDRGGDFHVFYTSAQHWRAVPVTPTAFGSLNPPILFLLTGPLSYLPFTTAFLVWSTLGLSLSAWAVRSICRMTTHDPILVFVFLIVCQAGFLAVAQGQITWFLLPLVTVAWIAEREDRPFLAGASLGVLVALKPFFGLFLIDLVRRRQWSAVISAGVAWCVCGAVGFLLAGVEGYRAYASTLQGVNWTAMLNNGSVWAFSARVFQAPSLGMQNTPLVVSPLAYQIVGWMLTIGILAVTWFASRRADADQRFALVGLASLLVSPLGWIYYLPVLAGPLLALVSRSAGPWRWYGLAGWLLLPPHLFVGFTSALGTATLRQWACWSLLGVWTLVLSQVGNDVGRQPLRVSGFVLRFMRPE